MRLLWIEGVRGFARRRFLSLPFGAGDDESRYVSARVERRSGDVRFVVIPVGVEVTGAPDDEQASEGVGGVGVTEEFACELAGGGGAGAIVLGGPAGVGDAAAGFFDAVGMRTVQGRPLSKAGPEGEVAINESLARALFGDADPIGRQFATSPKTPMVTIVGVMKDATGRNRVLVRQASATSAPSAIRQGSVSPIGDAVAIFPASVPRLRIWREPRRRTSAAKAGKWMSR